MQRSDSQHPIDAWIAQDRQNRSRSKLAGLVGCGPSRLTQICNDGEYPGRDLAIALQAATGIPASKLMGLDEDAA